MAELTPEERQALLGRLAQRIHGWHLGGPAQVLLGLGEGASVVASHLLLLLQPLTPFTALRQSLGLYATALEDDESWQALIEHLRALES